MIDLEKRFVKKSIKYCALCKALHFMRKASIILRSSEDIGHKKMSDTITIYLESIDEDIEDEEK